MGLLSKVESKSDAKVKAPENRASGPTSQASIDEMGKSLAERIKRLPQNENTPFTALSLLKAYANFNSAICLSLKNGVYSSYLALGAGVDKLSIPQEKVWTKDKKDEKFFRYDMGLKDDFNYWIFPLVSSAEGPWKAVMILEEAGSSFKPEAVSAIVSGAASKFYAQSREAEPEVLEEIEEAELLPEEASLPVTAAEETISKDQEIIREKITEFQETHGIFNCAIFDSSNNDYIDFSRKVSEMINTLGTVIPLSPAKPLILFPKSIDSELIIHRLSKTLDTQPILTFQTNNADNAISQIKSYIENGSGKDQVITFQI